MKEIIIELEEYNELIDKLRKTEEAFEKLREEYEKDPENRGYLIRHRVFYTRYIGNDLGLYPLLEIKNTDEVLEDFKKEIERLTELAKSLQDEKDKLEKENKRLMERSLWERIVNKEEEEWK